MFLKRKILNSYNVLTITVAFHWPSGYKRSPYRCLSKTFEILKRLQTTQTFIRCFTRRSSVPADHLRLCGSALRAASRFAFIFMIRCFSIGWGNAISLQFLIAYITDPVGGPGRWDFHFNACIGEPCFFKPRPDKKGNHIDRRTSGIRRCKVNPPMSVFGTDVKDHTEIYYRNNGNLRISHFVQ